MNYTIPVSIDTLRGVSSGTVREAGTDHQQLIYELTLKSGANARDVTNHLKNLLPSNFDIECIEEPVPSDPHSLTITLSR